MRRRRPTHQSKRIAEDLVQVAITSRVPSGHHPSYLAKSALAYGRGHPDLDGTTATSES